VKRNPEKIEWNDPELKNLVEKRPAYKILGDRKYSHCGFMKIMVPKNVSMGDNLFICIPYYMFCCTFIATIVKRFSQKWSCLHNYSIGFNVGTFHRFYAIAGFLFLVYADFWMYDPLEFRNAAVRSGGVLTASSSWLPNYTVENAGLRQFVIEAQGKKNCN